MTRTRTSNRDANPWANAATDPTAWHLTTPERRTELLNILPPIDVPGGFAVSEPIRHDANGRAVYLCVAEAHGDPWVRELALGDMAREIRELRRSA